MTIRPWRVLASQVAFSHRWYTLRRDVVELPNGAVIDDYFVSVRPDIALVFALTASGEIPLVRQYKHGAGEVTLELPAGTFRVGTEDPAEAAARELREETGYCCPRLDLIGVFLDDPTKNTSRVHAFLGEEAVREGPPELDRNEEAGLDVVLLPSAKLPELLHRGEISAMSSVAAIYAALDVLRLRGKPM